MRTKVLVLTSCLLATSLYGQASRTWVSGVGDDANPCSRTAPCKTFAGAISKTAAGGEISVLDPGGFGAVTITKSITINGTGTLAGIAANGTNGVIVNAGANDVVILKGISIKNFGAGTSPNFYGIKFLGAKRLEVHDTTIEVGSDHGIFMDSNFPAELQLSNVRITSTGGDSVHVSPASDPVSAVIERSIFRNGVNGIHFNAGSRLLLRDSSIAQMSGAGVLVETNSATSTQAFLEKSSITGGAYGVQSGPGVSVVRISDMSITGTTTRGLFQTGGTILSFNNNKISGNATDGAANAIVSQK